MYKVLFAEDELLVRLGLQNAVPWEKFQMEIAALAENGEEAYQLFEKVQPDVLITDLRMEGMDGIELVRRVRKIDKDCAIVVISCLNDFETLRKLIPYNINAYVLKASISIDEVCAVLQQTEEYLIEIGRKSEKTGIKSEKIEKQMAEYLLENRGNVKWEASDEVDYLLLFSLKEVDQEKINMLAMEFIYELINRKIPGELLVPLRDKEFCIFYKNMEKSTEEKIKRINNSIEEFLGIRFKIVHSRRKKVEDLKEWFDRTYAEQYDINYDENSGKALIQKSVTYMQEHYQESLSLTDISHIIGLSGNYFSYLFKKETGKNYVEYLNEIRLISAMKELKNSDEKILVIAQKHGFQNLEYFSRYFKKKTGESPAKWRKLNR